MKSHEWAINMKHQTRRKFLLTSTVAVGALVSARNVFAVQGGGLQMAEAKVAGSDFNYLDSNTSDSTIGVNKSSGKKILVTYASQFGSTAGCAESIAETLRESGNQVETQWVNDVANLIDYDLVIIGSAIQYDKWMPEARNFVKDNQNALSKLQVAYFLLA